MHKHLSDTFPVHRLLHKMESLSKFLSNFAPEYVIRKEKSITKDCKYLAHISSLSIILVCLGLNVNAKVMKQLSYRPVKGSTKT
jgi:hypothetical protein